MDIDELKRSLQDHFGDGLVTVVGSGLSCAEGLPGMGELATHLEVEIRKDLSSSDVARWEALSPLIKEKGLEAALLAEPPTGTLEKAIVEHTGALIAQKERVVIEEVFRRERTLRLTRLLKNIMKPSSGIPLITTNYDRLAEIAAEEAGLGVDTMFVGSFAGTLEKDRKKTRFLSEVTYKNRRLVRRFADRVNVYKPHGSLDWYHRDGDPVHYSGELSLPRLIITPGLNKFRNGYESPFDRHRDRGNEQIDRASRFLIVGYGFNDDHLETHLTHRIEAGVPTLILTHSLSPNAQKLVAANGNITAVISANVGGASASRVIQGSMNETFSGLSIWDLGGFVKEVLEP